ncbi:uncharacterized protein METZ01_LOCUS262461 [marine metagenome]|uniref:Bacterial sugar transferase domain-containing protein n=1 Tax=marine metagenome TaxID=408172 RepID=A0A382JEE7_9ZZZZ
MIKKLVDIVLSMIGIVFFSPIILVISFLILVFNGWPIFFIQSRLGKDLIPFNIIKFRTMKKGYSMSSENDAIRQTGLGKVLRKTSIDELPVLLNVLKGDMSLVGPRPLLLKYKDRFSKHQNRRHEILPGITGLAQIKGRNEISWVKKFEYDIQYVDSHSITMDIKLLIQTVFSVFAMKGITPKNQQIMPEFMGTEENESD